MTINPPKSLFEIEAAYAAANARRDVAPCTDLLIQMWVAEAAEDSPAPGCLVSASENDNAT